MRDDDHQPDVWQTVMSVLSNPSVQKALRDIVHSRTKQFSEDFKRPERDPSVSPNAT